MSQEPVATVETKTPKGPKNPEAFRLAQLLHDKRTSMVSDYRETIKHTGGLLTKSMVYAYSRCLDHVIRLLIKETDTETKGSTNEPVQEKK